MECPIIPTIQCQLNCPYSCCKHSDLMGEDDIEVSRSVDRQAILLVENRRYEEYDRQYRQVHKEEICQYNQKYRAEHKEYFIEYQRRYAPSYSDAKRIKDRQYYYTNCEKILLKQRDKYHEDHDLVLEKMRKRYAENKEEINRKRRAYRARVNARKMVEMGCENG